MHASAVLVGSRAVLIRGPAGSGKSRLALALIDAAAAGLIRFARLVADDRVELDRQPRPAAGAPAGGARRPDRGARRRACAASPYEAVAVAGLVIDLAAADGERMPASDPRKLPKLTGIRAAAAPGRSRAPTRSPAVLATLNSDGLT